MNKQQAIDFLKDLMVKIEVSDAKELDSKPCLFFIQQNKKLTASDGVGDGCWYRHEDDSELWFDSEEELEEFLSENEEYSADEFYEVEYQEIWETQELAFLTRESAQAHIDANHYHYTKPRTYSRGVWRDPLMEKMFKALHILYGKGIETE